MFKQIMDHFIDFTIGIFKILRISIFFTFIFKSHPHGVEICSKFFFLALKSFVQRFKVLKPGLIHDHFWEGFYVLLLGCLAWIDHALLWICWDAMSTIVEKNILKRFIKIGLLFTFLFCFLKLFFLRLDVIFNCLGNVFVNLVLCYLDLFVSRIYKKVQVFIVKIYMTPLQKEVYA